MAPIHPHMAPIYPHMAPIHPHMAPIHPHLAVSDRCVGAVRAVHPLLLGRPPPRPRRTRRL
eukprot:4561712-Prymnesium_polylepis.1